MTTNFEGLAAQLRQFDELTKDEMAKRYRKSLHFINEQLDAVDGGRRIGAARALVVAHGFAARYYARFGSQIDPEAFPGDQQTGDGPSLRIKAPGHTLQLQDLEDDLFEFVVALRPDYREELLALLEKDWIRAVLEP